MTKYNDLIARKSSEYGAKFDASDLNPAFIDYYNSGERIEVEIYGAKERGRVGITTGWKPVFLLIHRISDRGSSTTLGNGDKFLRTISR